MERKNMYSRIKEAVVRGDASAIEGLCKQALEEKLDPVKVLEEGLLSGVMEIGNSWTNGEAFITSVMLAALTANKGMDLVKPEIERRKEKIKQTGRVVIGTVEGDIHDLGKNLVSILLLTEGFEVHDLGVDVPADVFVKKVGEIKPNILCLSALMTLTMAKQKEVIEALRKAGLRDKVKVMVGGAPVTNTWAEEIGSDGYGSDAVQAARQAKLLLQKK